ncbi:hypothetical protein KUTeg_010449 [Tegillarca granosa]|uniref:Uncharacterized protein n=1 Tax=Tegillarca granosa TaxID=220873 RepID=A0ABQ9FA26_TEGGR|nr:hypothetical protein KUTeg_010449 [Tegillarca granosa]
MATRFISRTYHTLLAVDLRVPSSYVRTLVYPLFHFANCIPNGTVSEGIELKTYGDPRPPDNIPHQYYCLLYEQTSLKTLQIKNEHEALYFC